MTVPDGPLGPRRFARMRAMLAQSCIPGIVHVASGPERKARDDAAILATHLGLRPVARADLGENDRSATGCLPKPEIEATAEAFFAHTEASMRGLRNEPGTRKQGLSRRCEPPWPRHRRAMSQ